MFLFHTQMRQTHTMHKIMRATAIADVDMDSEAIQISYSMGGMSIKAYQMETTNPGYDSDATKHTATEISLGLAF